MFPKGTPDPEYPGDSDQSGVRLDSRNLVEEWLAKYQVMWVPRKGPRQGVGQDCACQGWLCAKTGCVPAGDPVCLESRAAHAGLSGPSSDSPHG